MSVAATVAPAAPASAPDALRVMIVDDAVVVRGLVSRWIDAEPDLKVVASLRTGREAVDQLLRYNPDVVLLDIEMPDLDGIEALPLLLEKKRDLIVIMASALTRRSAEVSLRALSLGAADYIPKPATNREVTTSVTFRRDLIEKVRQLGARRKRAFVGKPAVIPIPPARPRVVPVPLRAVPAPAIGHGTDIKLRPFSLMPPRVLLIGSSTGGPQALTGLVSEIAAVLERAPVLITQHMPPTFTTILAEHLARAGHCPAHEAEDGEAIVPGTIYLAPGGHHMSVTRREGQPAIAISDGPLGEFLPPRGRSAVFERRADLGQRRDGGDPHRHGLDGTHGAQDVAAAGGSVIAQDEASSVVWGMPGAAAECRRLFGGAAARSDRAETGAAVPGERL